MSEKDGMNSLKRKCEDNSGDDSALTASKQPKIQFSSVAEKEEDIEQETLLTDLPNEILARILDLVTFIDLLNVEQTNTRLRDVVLKLVWPKKNTISHVSMIEIDPRKSYSYDDDEDEDPLNRFNISRIVNKTLKAALSRTTIQHLDLSEYGDMLRFNPTFLLSMTPQLLSFDLSFFHIDEYELLKIARYCPLLEELSFEESFKVTYVTGEEDFNGEEGLDQVFIKCPNLKYLNLSTNEELYGNVGLVNIPNGLQHLNIARCPNINLEAFEFISSRAKNLETFVLDYNMDIPNFNGWLNNFPKLKYLELLKLKNNFFDFSILKNLEKLCLSHDEDGSFFNVETLQTLQHCPKLKSVDIDFNNNNQDNNNIFEIFKNFKALKFLHLQRCVDFDHKLLDLVQTCKLEYLAISKHKAISNEIINSLLTECHSLTHLEITDYSYENYLTALDAFDLELAPRSNVLNLVITESLFNFQYCKWCKDFLIDYHESPLFRKFTDVKYQYYYQKTLC